MVQAVCKNTFISFVAEPAENADDSMQALAPSPRSLLRSRSADCARCRPAAEEFEELTQPSLHRLNAVLSVGISSPLQSPQKQRLEVDAGCMLPAAEKPEEPIDSELGTGTGVSELLLLKGKLAKALATTPVGSPQQKPWDKHLRVSSNCSLSTMAPDDELAELPSMRRMPHVWSSGSVSTMVSDVNESLLEEDEVAFELDIEAGAEAARKAADDAPEAAPAASRSKMTLEMSHSQVPRNQNMEEMYNTSKDAPPTTMMIRNIPGRYSQNDLMMDLKDLGLAGTYDFLYMPMDKGTAANVGYAFVNFINHSFASTCMQSFNNFRFQRHQRSSNKLASVSVAHLQGLEKNLQHYENSAVNMSKEKRRRPVVVANIAKMFG